MERHPIGIFDSGYGGLTIMKEIRRILPQYDYVYLGDNARAPYGVRSFDVVYKFTLQAVETLLAEGCRLIILACNTASAKALRTIQQNDLPRLRERYSDPNIRVLGVIRPSVESFGNLTKTGHVGVLATPGTVASHSYTIETAKLFPQMNITEEGCPMWVPLVENGEADSDGADYFVSKNLSDILRRDPKIDTLLLGCTHYPILMAKIRKYVPQEISVVAQGNIVAESLKDYLHRHPEIETECSRGASARFLTTEKEDKFSSLASLFLGQAISAERITMK